MTNYTLRAETGDLRPPVTPEERAFILELNALSRKHGIVIRGCGCCNSPELVPMTDEQRRSDAGYSYGYLPELAWIASGHPWDESVGVIK